MSVITTPELPQCQQAFHERLRQALLLTAVGLLLVAAMQWLPAQPFLSAYKHIELHWLLMSLPAMLLLLVLLAWGVCFFRWMQLRDYAGIVDLLQRVLATRELLAARHALAIAREQAGQSSLNTSVLNALQPQLDLHMDVLTRQHLQQRLAADVASARNQCSQQLQTIRSRTPLIQAQTTVRETLQRLQKRREELALQWAAIYEAFSWWNKLKYPVEPDFKELDLAIGQMKLTHNKLLAQHAEDFTRLDKHFSELKNRAEARITASQQQIRQFIAHEPRTDIIIDGVAYLLKATSSAAYVNSVDPYIPAIATSEVAEQTRAIDSGFSNIELEHSADLALGGSVVDTKDTAIDALLTGVGGLGLFATIQGINHAADRYENGGDRIEALFEGAGVAIEGTARALVGTAELGYKVLTSAPSRFIGHSLLAGLRKLDDKMMETGSKPK